MSREIILALRRPTILSQMHRLAMGGVKRQWNGAGQSPPLREGAEGHEESCPGGQKKQIPPPQAAEDRDLRVGMTILGRCDP